MPRRGEHAEAEDAALASRPDDQRDEHISAQKQPEHEAELDVPHAETATRQQGEEQQEGAGRQPRRELRPAHRSRCITRPINSAATAAGNVTRFLIRRSSRSVIATCTSTGIRTNPSTFCTCRVVDEQIRHPQRDHQHRAGDAQRLAASDPRRTRLLVDGLLGHALAAPPQSAAAVSIAWPVWASRPGWNWPSPPHHGQVTSCGVPPLPEISLPVPRQACTRCGLYSAASFRCSRRRG